MYTEHSKPLIGQIFDLSPQWIGSQDIHDKFACWFHLALVSCSISKAGYSKTTDWNKLSSINSIHTFLKTFVLLIRNTNLELTIVHEWMNEMRLQHTLNKFLIVLSHSCKLNCLCFCVFTSTKHLKHIPSCTAAKITTLYRFCILPPSRISPSAKWREAAEAIQTKPLHRQSIK